jgi:hypothetical protein
MEDLLGTHAAGVAVGNNTDAVPVCDLRPGEIKRVAEEAADRRAEDMKNIDGFHRARLGGQMVNKTSLWRGNEPEINGRATIIKSDYGAATESLVE